MEEDFSTLLEHLGYRILRKRDPKSGLDIIAQFNGEPIPKPIHRCTLLKPLFSPSGITAYSLKRGDFKEDDVDELLEKVERARTNADDVILKSISGSVMVTNHSKTEEYLDYLISKNIFCWDIKRLIFYSTKVRSCFSLASNGPVVEYSFDERINGSYLQETGNRTNGIILMDVDVFIDDHNKELTIGYDETKLILNNMYEKSLKNIINSTQLSSMFRQT